MIKDCFLNCGLSKSMSFRQQMHKNLSSLAAIAMRSDEEQDKEDETFVADESFD